VSVWRFTDNAKITRRVSVNPSGTISVVDAVEDWFPALHVQTGRNRRGSDVGSPRRLRTDLLRHRFGILAPAGDPLRAGDRVDVGTAAFEVLEDAREVQLGRRVVAAEVPIMAIEKLYPFAGAIQEQGGAPIKASVRFSIYSSDETHDITGTYENYSAETDLGNHAECRVNHHLVADGNTYKITAAENDLVGGFVRMTVRKAGISG
jgi:hypothetical protein